MANSGANSFAHAVTASQVCTSKSPLKTAQHSIVLTFEGAAFRHPLALGNMQIPIFAKLLVNAFYQSAKKRETNGARNACTAHEYCLALFLRRDEVLRNVRAIFKKPHISSYQFVDLTENLDDWPVQHHRHPNRLTQGLSRAIYVR